MFNDYGMSWEAQQYGMKASDIVLQKESGEEVMQMIAVAAFVGICAFCFGCMVTLGVVL